MNEKTLKAKGDAILAGILCPSATPITDAVQTGEPGDLPLSVYQDNLLRSAFACSRKLEADRAALIAALDSIQSVAGSLNHETACLAIVRIARATLARIGAA